MKYSLGKPKLLIQADDFYDFMSQEASAFFAFINAFSIFLRRLIMLTSLSLIFLVGLVMGAICQKLKLPRIIGMLLTGIVLGPYVLDFLDPSILSISADLRKMALIIILIKAGLSLDLKDLKKAGRSAILMSFVPASCEIIGYILLAPVILGINHAEAAVMGAVLAAVSPAVVVPRMVMLIEKRYGTAKAIPQMILSGASCDDIFVIVLFTTFLNVAQGGRANVIDFVNIPVSIILGIILGIVTGLGLYLFFETSYARKNIEIAQFFRFYRIVKRVSEFDEIVSAPLYAVFFRSRVRRQRGYFVNYLRLGPDEIAGVCRRQQKLRPLGSERRLFQFAIGMKAPFIIRFISVVKGKRRV